MTACVIIVSAHADMLALCRAALRVHAPQVRVCVVATSPEVTRWSELGNEECLCLPDAGQGARDHAAGIEYARSAGVATGADLVILLDDDTIILSDRWWELIETVFSEQPEVGIIGGVRSRGLIGQAYVDGLLLIHAHMMAMRVKIFLKTSTFHAEAIGMQGYVRCDTGVHACFNAEAGHYAMHYIPFYEPGMGVFYPGIAATEYYERNNPRHPLWAHLGRGTSFAPRGWWREWARRRAAQLGSPRAAKILRRQDERRRFIERSWELLMGRRP